MMYGGSLSLQRMRVRDDVSVEFRDLDLDQRLPTSTRGSLATAVADLADLGVRPGRYSGVEQTFAGGGHLSPAIEASTCEITADGFLAVINRGSGETTTFAWANDRWRWSPYAAVTVEAMPRRVGALVVVDVFSCDGGKQTAVARLLLAAEN
jgi:hypothetical protein